MSVRRLLAVLLGALLVVASGACGIDSDSSPRALAEDQVPEELVPSTTTTTTPGGAPARTVEVSFLSDDVLRAVARQIEVRTGIEGAVEALLAGPTPEEEAAGLTTSIPAGTQLLDVAVSTESGLLTLDLSEELQRQEGSELRNAVAQLVFTATSVSGDPDQQVRFQIDGEVVSVPADQGATANVVTRADYADLDPATADASD